jgi:hypothetical protein
MKPTKEVHVVAACVSAAALLHVLFHAVAAVGAEAVADKTIEAPEQTDVFVSGQEGYHTYRIPAIVVSKKRTLLAFCEGRKRSRADHGDIDLVLK